MTKTCAECGGPIKKPVRHSRHCSTDCREAFTRRRRDRGAEVYDFLMAGDTATVAKLVGAYHQADTFARDGRPSWKPRDTAIQGIPITYSKQGDKR